jgi:hypothetical protein
MSYLKKINGQTNWVNKFTSSRFTHALFGKKMKMAPLGNLVVFGHFDNYMTVI